MCVRLLLIYQGCILATICLSSHYIYLRLPIDYYPLITHWITTHYIYICMCVCFSHYILLPIDYLTLLCPAVTPPLGLHDSFACHRTSSADCVNHTRSAAGNGMVNLTLPTLDMYIYMSKTDSHLYNICFMELHLYIYIVYMCMHNKS